MAPNLAYQCLIIDHDDTAVDSTVTIHYPAYLEAMRILRPHYQPLGLEDFFRKHIDPGFMAYLRDELELTPEELQHELEIWRGFARERTPEFYPGMLDFLKLYRKHGGIIVVSSHSEIAVIEKDYRANDQHLIPDLIFGWDESGKKTKPNPYPVFETLTFFGLRPEQLLVLDDLKWGILMGKSAGVATAAAGWGHRIPEIIGYMRQSCDYYFETVEMLQSLVLGSGFTGL